MYDKVPKKKIIRKEWKGKTKMLYLVCVIENDS